MKIALFEKVTTEAALVTIEKESETWLGLHVSMDDPDERRFVKDKAVLINELLRKVDRFRIDNPKKHRAMIEEEARSITERLECANKPFTSLIDAYKAKCAKELEAKRAQEAAERLAQQYLIDEESAHAMNELHDLRAAELIRQRLEQVAAELKVKEAREKQVADDAAKAERERLAKALEDEKEKAAQAIKYAEYEKEKAILLAAQQVEDAKALAEKVNQDAIDLQAENDRKQKATEQKAEQDRLDAVENERKRLEQVAIDEKAAAAKREANKGHARTINLRAVECLVDGGVSEDDAKLVVRMIATGRVDAVTISY